MRRTRRLASALAALALTAALLAGCGGSSSGRVAVDHALQRPARADDRLARRRLREADRHQRQRAQRRRGHARRRDRHGGLQLAGRRDLHRELARARVPAGQGPARPGRRPRRSPSTPEQVQLAAGRLGRRLGPRQRADLQPEPDQRQRSCRRTVLELADPRYRGKLAFAAGETDFQPIVTSVARTYGQRRGAEVAGRDQGERRRPHLPRQRDDRRRGQPRRGRVRGRQPVLLVPHAAPRSAPPTSTRRSPTSPRTTPATCSTSRAPAVLKSSKHKAAAQKFLAFLVSRQGQEIIAHSISFEYPIAAGVTTAAPETPFDQLQPNPITIAELGDGSTAIALLRKAGLL